MIPAVTLRRSVCVLAVIAGAACRTAPVPSAPAPFFFIQMSDPQFGMFTANKDFAQETVNFERAIAAANRLRPAFVVVTGDLTNAQGDSAQIAEYHRIIAQLDQSIPLYSVPGNHDVALPLSAASLAAYRTRYGPDRFTFERNGVHGIVINSSLIKEPLAVPEETAAQEAWLRAAVAQARARGSGRTIVFQHHSWFLSRADEADQYFNLPLAKRREYLDLFQRNGVRHVFAGHYHRNAYGRDGDLEMVTTGPVGKPLGPDPSGFRIVTVDGDGVTHRYYGLDSIPDRVSADASVTAFTNVSVIDGRDSVPRRDQTVIVQGDRITASGAASAIRVPANARTIDGRGQFLIPGLWDMHVHTVTVSGRELLGLYVANGVTGVRDMASDWATIRQWREEIARGTLVGPRLVSSGPYLEGGDVPIAHILTRTPDEGRAGVDSLVTLGVDFVKVHGQLTPATYFAIARRARERGIAFAGHVSRTVGSAAASDSGQRSIEHLLAIPAPCTSAESIALAPRFTVQGALGRCTSVDLAPLYQRFVRNGTWVTPTFVAQVEVAAWPTHDVPGDSLAHYLPDTLRRYVAQLFPMPDSIPAGADAVGRAMLAKRMAQVAAMHRAGVRVLTGTDAPLRNSPPGFGLHEELLMLVRGGMSNFDVLRAATLEPARYFGWDSYGTVEMGKVADLVLLDANPLLDIRNTRRISVVVANGRLIGAAERMRLLQR